MKSKKKLKKTNQKESKKSNKSAVDFSITHPEKIVYPEDKYTKQALLEYYNFVCDYMLPFIENRPISLMRCPENYKECFFQRHFNNTTPKALKAIDIETKGDIEPYIYLDDREGLLSLVQMGVLEIHPWGSTITALETPDIIIIDLDPAPDVTWKTIVAAAFDIKTELAQVSLRSFIKTTGGKGLHVVIPIIPEYTWDDVKQFTHIFVDLEKKKPNQYISKMTKSKRGGKIFVDYLRNQRSATAIGAYSTRSRVHAPVSVPIEWEELTNRRTDTAYTIKTLPKRLLELKKDRAPTQKSFMWLFLGGPPSRRAVVYQYHHARGRQIPKDFFADFKGYVHADCYQAYVTLGQQEHIHHVTCWAHARRYFVDVAKAHKKQGLAHQVVALIGKLYHIERELKDLLATSALIFMTRVQKSRPIVLQIKALLDEAQLDNNLSERAIKPFVIGRKNWLFNGNDLGAKAASILFSLIETCTFSWFKYVLTHIRKANILQKLEQILPYNIDPSLLADMRSLPNLVRPVKRAVD